MKRYAVVFSEDAVVGLSSCLQWGCETWGEEAAREWYVQIRASVRKILTSFPMSQPVAPDNDEYDVKVRQMVIGRYRVLFTVDQKRVTILHVTGPYVR